MALEPNTGNLSEYLSENNNLLEEVKDAVEDSEIDITTLAKEAKQDSEIALLQDIKSILSSAAESKFSNDSGTLATALATANVEYLVVVFRVKAGQGSVKIDDLMVSLNSVSNDDLLIRLGINKTFSDAGLGATFQSVAAASKLEFARPGINGAAAAITVTGFDTGGRNVQSMQMKAQTDFVASGATPITIPEGVLYSMSIIPRSNGGSVYDSQNWSEQ